MNFLPTRWPVVVLPAARSTFFSMEQNRAECCVPVCRKEYYVVLFWWCVWPKEQYVYYEPYAMF